MPRCFTLTTLLAVSLAGPALAQGTREQQLNAFFANLRKVAEAGDKAGYLATFESDAVMFLPHRAPLLGRAQIGDWFARFQSDVALMLDSYKQEKVDIIGDVALVRSRGVGHYLIKATGDKLPFDQAYLDVLRYDRGKWTMTHHVASSARFEPGLWERDWEHR